jgi:subtilase family serine protease
VGTTRGTPDVSADANPYTGVWVYDSFPNDYSFSSVGWWIVGGTSLSTPVWAGVINRAGSFAASSPAELSTLYSHLGVAGDFHDVVGGQCYYYAGLLAVAGYDECTGIGSPHSYAGK